MTGPEYRLAFITYVMCSMICSPSIASSAQGADSLPLEPARRISFDVDEGTWMSIDVSPDGDTVIFDLLGDIYTVPVSGGGARRIRSGMAFDAQPVYSPDGSMIAFISDQSGSENLWIAKADGTEPRMVSSEPNNVRFSSPEWSADGNSLFVSRRAGRHGAFQLWLYHIVGGTGFRIKEQVEDEKEVAGSQMLGIAPSADGAYLYYARRSTASATLYSIPAWNIARRALRTGKTKQLVTALTGAVRPQISPNGRMLVYGTRMDGETGLRIRDLISGNDRWLAYPMQRDNQDVQFNRDILPRYAFTPDGNALIAAYGGKIRRIDIESRSVEVLPFTAHVDLGVGPTLIRNQDAETGPVRARLIQHPSQSPDGKRLAFSALARLYIANLADGNVRLLAGGNDPAFQPAWSPDGRWITFVTWDAANAGHVWKIRSNGGRPQRLTSIASFYSEPVFSPDGEKVYALSSNNFERMRLQEEVTPRRFADLVKISANGGAPETITHIGVGAQRPFVANDPERVFYTTPDGVVSVLGSGTEEQAIDQRMHLRVEGLHAWSNAGRPHPVSDVQISPDGERLLTIVASQLYLMAVPPISDGVPVINLLESAKLPRMQISQYGADHYAWADNGKTITWVLGSTFFRQPLDAVDSLSDGAKEYQPEMSRVEDFEIVVEVPRDIPRGTLLLRGATAITMKGDEVIDDADVLVVNERIAALGKRGSVEIPGDAVLRDVSDAYIVPGFVDTHAHWYEIRHDILDLQNWSFLSNLAFGVTSGLDVQAMDQDMFVYQDLLDAGLMVGPRAWSVGQGMFANNEVDSAEEADDLVRRYADFYRTLNIKSYLIGNRQQRQWIVQASARHGVLPTTEGNSDLKLGLTHAIDGFAGNEHELPVVPLFEDVVRLFAETQIAYTPTLMIVSDAGTSAKDHFFVTQPPHDDPKVRRFMPHYISDTRTSPVEWVRPEERMYPRVAEGAAKILRAGGRVGIGSHAEFQGVAYHWEMQALTAGGLTPHEVLRAATEIGSRIIGRANDIGTIEPGKFADLLILDRNPLDDIRNARAIRYVMKNGRMYDANTLDEIWPRQRELPPLWHQEELREDGS